MKQIDPPIIVGPYIRIGIFEVHEVLPFIEEGKKSLREYLGKPVNMCSQRYKVFEKSLKCATCDLEGKYFALEKHKSLEAEIYHFNLYAIDKDGKEVLMTKDHRIAVAKGGMNYLENLTTMCIRCNQGKASNCDLSEYQKAEEVFTIGDLIGGDHGEKKAETTEAPKLQNVRDRI